jgi:hypothetical protein
MSSSCNKYLSLDQAQFISELEASIHPEVLQDVRDRTGGDLLFLRPMFYSSYINIVNTEYLKVHTVHPFREIYIEDIYLSSEEVSMYYFHHYVNDKPMDSVSVISHLLRSKKELLNREDVKHRN